MAIFRAGIRIGPFDLRAGFPRDRSLDNVDRDPRLKQRANTENTIGRFRASMAAASGYARPARFAVRLFPPTGLANIVKQAQEEAGTGDAAIAEQIAAQDRAAARAGAPDPTGKAMHDLSQTLGRQINIHCDSVSMPAHDLTSETITKFGPPRQMVTGHGFTGTIAASFYADKYLRERHFMEMWQKMAVSMVTHKVGYYDDYIGKMHIYQLGALDGDGAYGRDYPTYGIEATEVYPETIGAVEYNYGSTNAIVKINVGFQYKEWHNLATDSIAGMEFDSSVQVLHPVRAKDKGLFGMLPPELQRLGRSVINQAKTQLPIGKIFKGKIFPPYT
tara:strand:- start:91 stop:1086 length:996 start_codon:yes stop_codon:yes gene_type:complete